MIYNFLLFFKQNNLRFYFTLGGMSYRARSVSKIYRGSREKDITIFDDITFTRLRQNRLVNEVALRTESDITLGGAWFT